MKKKGDQDTFRPLVITDIRVIGCIYPSEHTGSTLYGSLHVAKAVECFGSFMNCYLDTSPHFSKVHSSRLLDDGLAARPFSNGLWEGTTDVGSKKTKIHLRCQ